MRRSFHHIAAAALAAAMIAGQALTAFAAQDYSNYGPAFAGKDNQVSQEAPDGSVGPGESPGPEGGQAGGQAAAEPVVTEGQAAEGQTSTGTTAGGEGDAQGEVIGSETTGTATPASEEVVPSAGSQAYLQIQMLREDMVWSEPAVDHTPIQSIGNGFLSVCIFANNLPGDVLYRTYSTANGWSRWAMNGGHTDWVPGVPIEAVQIRLNGVFGNYFDVYYSSTLSDGTQCGWSKNGGTNGTMGTGNFIQAFSLSMWGKGVEAPYDMTNPLAAAAPDGIQFDSGFPVYSQGTGEPFTGWAWNDRDRYYFVNNAAVTGWQYIDGYKYFFESDGRLVTDLEPHLGNAGPFLIKINKQMNCTTIYTTDGENGFIVPFKSFICSTGDDTPLGNHKTPEKYRWRLMVTDEYCQYLTRLGKGLPILLHSVIYEKANPYTLFPHTYNYLGANKSHGCIRFTTGDAKWIYDNCPLGTTVTVYESPDPGPFDRPAIQVMIPESQTWDPTDPTVPENGLQ